MPEGRMRASRAWSIRGLAASATVLAISFGVTPQLVPRAAAALPYNVVIIVTDDQRWDMIRRDFTPEIWNRLVIPGRRFKNAFVPNPLCCPSRASILSGNYSHTTGVWSNRGPHGGFGAFGDKHTIAVDFDAAGYRTAMIGKYLNGYAAGKNRYVPPGWDRWFATQSRYYDYGVTTQSRLLRFGSDPEDHQTGVIARQAKRFVRRSVSAEDPFFLYLSFFAPHAPSTPEPIDVGRFDWVTPADTDTPEVRNNMLEAAFGVDRAVGALVQSLPDHTIVLYLSDNGFLWGEHGLNRKGKPYDESIRIPMILTALDGSFTPVAGTHDLVLNVDARPTLTRAAGVPMLTRSEGVNWNGSRYVPRDGFVIHNYPNNASVPSFCGVRLRGWMFTRWADGSELLFDMRADPEQETDLAGEPSFQAERDRLLLEAQDACDPPPPGYVW